jgi:hypothetical protein
MDKANDESTTTPEAADKASPGPGFSLALCGIALMIGSAALIESIMWTDSAEGALWGLMFYCTLGLPVVAFVVGVQYLLWFCARKVPLSGKTCTAIGLIPPLALAAAHLAPAASLNPHEFFCRRHFTYHATDAYDDVEFVEFFYSGGIDPYYAYKVKVSPDVLEQIVASREYTTYLLGDDADDIATKKASDRLRAFGNGRVSVKDLGPPTAYYEFSETPTGGDYYYLFYWQQHGICALEIINI